MHNLNRYNMPGNVHVSRVSAFVTRSVMATSTCDRRARLDQQERTEMSYFATMSTRSICVTVLLPTLFALSTSEAGDENTHLVRMPVRYKETMVVVVSREGAGAVRFIDP